MPQGTKFPAPLLERFGSAANCDQFGSVASCVAFYLPSILLYIVQVCCRRIRSSRRRCWSDSAAPPTASRSTGASSPRPTFRPGSSAAARRPGPARCGAFHLSFTSVSFLFLLSFAFACLPESSCCRRLAVCRKLAHVATPSLEFTHTCTFSSGCLAIPHTWFHVLFMVLYSLLSFTTGGNMGGSSGRAGRGGRRAPQPAPGDITNHIDIHNNHTYMLSLKCAG